MPIDIQAPEIRRIQQQESMFSTDSATGNQHGRSTPGSPFTPESLNSNELRRRLGAMVKRQST